MGPPLAPTVRGLVEGGKRANSTCSNRYPVDDLRRNPDVVAELKINEVALASSMKSIIAYSIARGAHIDQSHSLNRFIDLNRLVRPV
jgi:hypothetical protein